MGASNEELLNTIRYYQESLDKYTLNKNNYKLLSVIEKLKRLPISTSHLEDTGIGRTVNGLRKLGGDIGDAAKSLVTKWKEMVVEEEEKAKKEALEESTTTEEDVDNYDEGEINETDFIERDKDSSSSHRSSDTERISEKYKHDVDKYTSSHDKGSTEKRDRHRDRESSGKKRKQERDNESEGHSSKKRYKSNSESEDERHSKSKSKRRHKSESSDDEEEDRKHKSKKYEQSSDSSDSEDSDREYKSKSSHSSRDRGSSKSKSRDKTESKKKDYDAHSKRDKEKSKSKHRSDNKSTRDSDCEENKHRSKKEKSLDMEETKEKSKHDSKSKHEKSSSKSKDSKSHSSHSEKHEARDKKESKMEDFKEKHSHKKDESRRHDEKHKKSKEEKENNKREKSSTSGTSKSEESIKSSSSSKHKSGSEKRSKDKEKAVKHIEKEKIINGIDSGSGASFADALGMCGPMISGKSSSVKKKKSSTSPALEKPKTSSGYLRPEKVEEPEEDPVPSLLKCEPPEPLNINISSLLPEITPHYKPLGLPLDSQPRKMLTPDEALSQAISNKNMRTKVYSGNKSHGKVETLFDLCVRVLQDNIDALEYTGGVPYIILKPVLDRATPDQLFNLEHHNPYLIEDTDELWALHCQKEFRTKKREELESWREMYMRCLDEREAKLNAITANIKQSQDKSTPVRTTKLAYIDSVVKPPRNILRKQAKNGIIVNKKPTQTPSSRLSALATSGDAGKVAVPNPGSRAVERSNHSSAAAIKPKKAPLMAKTLSLLKNRFRR